MAAQAPLPDHGRLSEIAVPVLLLRLYENRWSGKLVLSRGKTRKIFELQDGAPIASESNIAAERLTGVLEHAGSLSRADRDRVDALVASEKCQEGVALLKLELIEPKALFLGLCEQLRHRAVEAFGWANGEFKLEPSEDRREDVQPFRTDPYALVQEGLQTHWSVDRLLSDLQDRMDLYPRPGKRFAEASRRLVLDAGVERMIAGLNGSQKLGVLACGAGSSPAAVATFWVLNAIDVLTYADTPARSDSEAAAAPEIEIQIRGEATPDSAGPTPSPVSRAADGAKKSQSAAATKMRSEIAEKLAGLAGLNHYELLGVVADAPHAAIRKAYFQAAKLYHPDAIARLGLEDIRTEAGEIFTRIALANEILSDTAKRDDYDRSLSGDYQEIDVTTLAQAETFYRKGEILIRMGDFRQALEYLQNAVELYPDEAVYQRDLGWAYYKKQPPEPEPAFEHLQRALELDPNDNVAQFRIDVVGRGRS